MIYQEADLEFNFGNYNAIKLDVQGEPLPEGMLLIDFFVERQRDSLLLYHEAKEPWKRRFVKSCHVVNQNNIQNFGISIQRK